MLSKKKKEGKPLPDTQDMKIWREEFDAMDITEHNNKLKSLGLDDEDIEEFDAVLETHKKGENVKLEDLDEDFAPAPEEEPKKKK
ncbi:MAG: hypothetical protein COV47_01720 [Candidatus Diapherotrites archaeon CG11_big_fil_rev_8_21_14_0_20_37_9]|nr:MAG: hypothetical protein COV47_01720 [Candidatus Diapherotrites archaeon CG11_big_fil_rev_8_21_14_0_20_37_9]